MARHSKFGVSTNVSGIYLIKNIKNKKVYIGSAISLISRLSKHIHDLKNNKHHSIHLQNAWNKYGEDCFIFGIVEIIEDKNQLTIYEQKYMDKYMSFDQNYGYNVCPLAKNNLGCKHQRGLKEKSIRSKGINNGFYGKKHTIDSLKKISEFNYMKKLTSNDVEKIKYLYNYCDINQKNIAKMYGVVPSHISKILNNKRRNKIY